MSGEAKTPTFEDVRLMIREEIRAALNERGMVARHPCGRAHGTPCPHFPAHAHQCQCESPHAGLQGVTLTSPGNGPNLVG